jgi:hypothetical protein
MNFGNCDASSNGEEWVLHHLARSLPAPTVFDVGANVGEYTQRLLRAFGPEARVHAFEPSWDAFTELRSRTHIDAHHIAGRRRGHRRSVFGCPRLGARVSDQA